jgi:iron complex outermembrane receptor protein
MKDMQGGLASLRQNIALAALLVSLAGAAEGQKAARDLTEASLEDLMNIEVTTGLKREQKLSQTPAAGFVITQEDIRRSGMTTNKLLVPVDGRSVYSPVNAGVTWEEMDTLLEGIVTIRPHTRATIGRSFFVKRTWGF